MSGVVVWTFKNNRNGWSLYEPAVSCELERLFSLGTQHTISLGSLSSSLSCYEVSLVHMTQTNIPTGSRRDIKRFICSPTSAVGQGVVWEFEGDTSNQWSAYDLATMDVIEDGYLQHGQMNMPILDLQQSHVQLPYVIDFARMTQMRVETGRIRRVQRRPLGQTFSTLTNVSFSASPLSVPASSSMGSSFGQTSWQQQATMNTHTAKSANRHHPYSHKSTTSGAAASSVNGTASGPAPPASLPSQVSLQTLQQQQLSSSSSQSAGPLTRRRHHLAGGGSAAVAVLQQHPHIQPHAQQQPVPQMYPGSQPPSSSYFHQPLQHHHHHLQMASSYQHLFNHVSGSMPGLQFPSSTPLSAASMGYMPAMGHQQMSRASSSSSLSSTSSSSSSMSVSGSQPTETLPSVFKVTIPKSKKTKGKPGVELVVDKYMRRVETGLDSNDCPICCGRLSEASSYGGEGQPEEAHAVVELNRCGHQFHKLCLLEMYRTIHKGDCLQCPSCKTIYGEKTGNCPPGYMQWRLLPDLTLPGYEACGSILVSYHISPGTQTSDHPNPGQSFTTRGFPRQGYLPDCDKGRKVLKLLMEAFRRRLMFTVATSHTTGEANTVTWNEIHHKTEPYGNSLGHGYPDPAYLDNVLMELAAHGVTEDSLPPTHS